MKEFPPFHLDTVNQCLWRDRGRTDQERVLLTPRAYALLRFLVEHPGRLLTHDELLDALWPNTHVQPEVLKSHIFEIRTALGDNSKKPLFIETLPRRGYRFIAPVSAGAASGPSVASATGGLVGRDRPLATLREALQRALTGERQIVFVTGEPGIGKTALVDEFQRQAALDIPNLRIGRGQCIEGYGSKEAYYPMLEALGQLCRVSSGETIVNTLAVQAPTWLVQFPAMLTREHRETLHRELLGATRERMLREIGEALEAIASQTPLLLVFEDLQWVDHSTADLISVLARRRMPAPLMLIGTYRSTDVAIPDHPLKALKPDLSIRHLCREVTLEPLGEDDVAEYLATESSQALLPDGLARLLYRHSEGNPLFLVAVLDHMTERGFISRDRERWRLTVALEDIDLAVPENLRLVIDAQIERLTSDEQRALEVASVATGPSSSVIARAAASELDPDVFEELCERLARRNHIIRSAGPLDLPDGTTSPSYDFVHALYREVLYRRVPAGRRARLHRHIGEWGESLYASQPHEAAPWLAYQFESAGDWARAIAYLRLVSDTAGRRHAPREATAILQHALDLSTRLPEPERATTETGVLEQLATMYVVSFDTRAVDTSEALAARAASCGLIDVEVKALIDMVYPLSWTDAERALQLIDRALRLSAQQSDPLQRARTRASCLVRRIWAGGWNPQDAEDCRQALEEIRRSGDRLMVASHLIEFNFIRWVSSEYRAARQDAVDSIAILADARVENIHLSFAHWLSHFTLPWSLLFLGEWGQALQTLTANIMLADKNGERYRAQTLQLYRAWIHLHAMDFPAVQEICGSVLPSFDDPAGGPWRRFCLALAGSAEAASGRYEAAEQHLLAARGEMDRRPLIHDWYSRMILEGALSELWLAKRDLAHARLEAERFLELTRATAERTWQALAWDTNARVATAERDFNRAQTCIDHALSTMEGFEVPLAAWRAHGTAAELYARLGNNAAAEQHRALSRATILRLADSLPHDEPLRARFLSAPAVRRIVDPARDTRPRSTAPDRRSADALE
jgi:DNA-binding winged helix-turn-helix (wHTH) protein